MAQSYHLLRFRVALLHVYHLWRNTTPVCVGEHYFLLSPSTLPNYLKQKLDHMIARLPSQNSKALKQLLEEHSNATFVLRQFDAILPVRLWYKYFAPMLT